MAWIKTIPYDQSTGKLRMLYDRVKHLGDNADNAMMAHSLRPQELKGQMAIYKYVYPIRGGQCQSGFLTHWAFGSLRSMNALLRRSPLCGDEAGAGR